MSNLPKTPPQPPQPSPTKTPAPMFSPLTPITTTTPTIPEHSTSKNNLSLHSINITTTPLSTSQASKLSTVIGDGSFESIMKARAMKRKEKDEHCVAELRVAMSNMDSSLTQEIKRRIENTKTMEKVAEKKIEEMELRLNEILDEKVQAFRLQLQLLENKVQGLNERLEEEKSKIPQDIAKRGKELREMMLVFQNEFSMERRDRLTREGRIMKQLSDHAQVLTEKWEKEGTERGRDVQQLKMQLDHHENNRAKADLDFEALIVRELGALRGDVEKEKNERKVEDDEIVEALNRYTENLQKSLSMLD